MSTVNKINQNFFFFRIDIGIQILIVSKVKKYNKYRSIASIKLKSLL